MGEETVVKALSLFTLIAVAISLYSMIPRTKSTQEMIFVTMPSLMEDINRLVDGCNVSVISIVPPGVDPHHYNLDVKSATMAKKAILIVSTAHAPYELQLRNLGVQDRLVEITSLPGIRYYNLPWDGSNKHMPIYDPQNYEKFIIIISEKLEEKLPLCKGTIENNMNKLLGEINEIMDCQNIIGNTTGVAASPFTQYAASWLGINVKIILASHDMASISPSSLSTMKTLLEEGGLALVAVNDNGEPIDEVNKWLYREALSAGSSILEVPSPTTQQATIEKLVFICNEVKEMNNTTSSTIR